MADTKLAKVGITVKEPWAADISYEALDYVLWRVQDGGDGCGYIAKRDNIGVQPGSDDETWEKGAQAGQSIYDLAVKYHHFEGTEEEFEAEYQAALAAANAAAAAASETNTQVQNAEALRVSAEQSRVTAETARVDAESRRATAELTRDNDETARQAAEAIRSSNETGRVSAESGRASAESGRVSAESARVAAENERRADFESLETDMQTAIGRADAATSAAGALNEQVQSNENDRVTAEQGRVSAEQSRVTAETARETQASSDHTRAEGDHTTAAADHATATQDHTTAESDHTTASADHTQAEEDHTASVAATGSATAAAATANTAAEAADEAREGIQDDLARKANKDGYYETLAVGIAKNLEGRNDVTDSFMERTTGGDAEVANGAAQLMEVAGKSQVWNQLIQNGDFSDGTTRWDASGATLSAADGILTWTANNATASNNLITVIPFINGHKYYIGFFIKGNADNVINGAFGAVSGGGNFDSENYSTTWKRIAKMATPTTNTTNYLYLRPNAAANDGAVAYFRNIRVHDLTLLGIDNLTTVEEVEAWLAENIGLREYYPYNAGTVLNSKMQGIESLGFNLLDPATGKARIVGAYSDVYGNYYGITGTHGTLTFTSDLGETSEITPDSDGKFLIEEPGWLDVATPGADCAVFLWWDGTQTDYQPYERNTGDLDVTHIYGKLNGTGELVQVFPDGMAGIGTVKDVLRIEDGVTVTRKRIGKVDMGTLTYSYLSTSNAFVSAITKKANGGNVLTSKYVFGGIKGSQVIILLSPDKSVYEQPSNKNLFVKDSAYTGDTTGEAALKSALSGVPLYFELATEQLYTDLVYQGSSLFADGTPVELPVNYRVNNWGIERMIPQNDSGVVTTFPELTCRYSIDAVEQLNTHTDEIEDLYEGLEELEELDAKKADKTGSYPDMAVGSAKAIEGNDTKVEDFTFTPIQCADGLAKINDVMGKSLVWNQLVKDYTQSANIRATGSSTIQYDAGKIRISITEAGSNNAVCIATGQFIAGHKIACLIEYTGTRPEVSKFGSWASAGAAGNTLPTISRSIKTMITTGDKTGGLWLWGVTTDFEISSLNIIDLTLLFGAGNEPSTVADFEALFPLPYYAYNAGTLISNKTEQVKVVGFNQWDEEYEEGYWNAYNGQPGSGSNWRRSKNPIPALPSTDYYWHNGNASNTSGYLVYYDSSMGYLGSSVSDPAQYGYFHRTPDKCAYIHFYAGATNFSTDKICINISDPSRNGTYEPYKKNTVELNLPTLTGKVNGEGESVVIASDGLKSAGSVYDEGIVENGYITKIVKRIGVVDMGTLNYTKGAVSSSYPYGYFASPVAGRSFTNVGILCSKYPTVAAWNTDKVIRGTTSNSNIYVIDSAYAESDAATFKTAMSGVMLYYELATPVTYILDTPIPATFQAYKGGTLKQLPENTSTPTTAPMIMENVYAIDAVGILTGLPQNYVSKESLQAMLTAMQSAGLFSAYTMTWDGSKYTFTFTANPTE